MDAALAQSLENLERARMLSELAEALPAVGVALDLSDLHRAAIVLGVSALDHFVHEVTRTGILKAHNGLIVATEAHQSFRVPLSSVGQCLAQPGQDDWLDAAIRASHSFQTFQHPDRIADAIRMISPVKLWDEVGKHLGKEPKAVKNNLIAIVSRRNTIAHEADMNHLSPGERWPIDADMVREALLFLGSVIEAIAAVADQEKAP